MAQKRRVLIEEDNVINALMENSQLCILSVQKLKTFSFTDVVKYN